MFICAKCASKCLSQKGKDFGFFTMSFGRCEFCERGSQHCLDVHSGANWAWKNKDDIGANKNS